MIQRFQIEDLVIQDLSGVVFRAFDTITNQTVAVRRFFPFGANGGGLREDEQTAYNIAVGRLATITHPALRAVICGGCDPVDGMPYIATEWLEGLPLESFIRPGLVEPAAAANVLLKALEVCELLSDVLAEEAVWVETSLQAIVVGAEGTGRGVTFWIAPLKWLGKNDGHRGLEPIITLTEEIMGWTGKSVSDQADHGLEGWLKWLRGKAQTTTLRQAREMLAAFIGVEPPATAKKPAHQPTCPPVMTRRKKSWLWPIAVGAAVALVAIASGGYFFVKRSNTATAAMALEPGPADLAATTTPSPEAQPEAPAPATARSEQRSVDQENRKATELMSSSRDLDRQTNARRTAVRKQGNVFAVGDRQLLLERKGSEVRLEGRLAEVRLSNSGATLYLEFSKPAANDEPRGYIMQNDLTEAADSESLRKLVGKNVRLSGKVNTPSSKLRPEIQIKNFAAIQEVP